MLKNEQSFKMLAFAILLLQCVDFHPAISKLSTIKHKIYKIHIMSFSCYVPYYFFIQNVLFASSEDLSYDQKLNPGL